MATNNAINLPGPTPVLSAVLGSSAASVTGAGSAYQIVFDTVLVDTTSSYDNTTGIYTIPANGIYFISCNFTYGQYTGTNTNNIWAYISINGAPYQFALSPGQGSVSGYYGPNNWLSFAANITLPLTAGNQLFVKVIGSGNSSGNLDSIVGYSPATAYVTCFNVHKIAQV